MIKLNSDISDRFASLAKDVFGLSIDEYLVTNKNRSLFGYAIDRPKYIYFPIFGNPPYSLTEAINTKFVDSLAGYKVNVSSIFPSINVNADLLLLSTELNLVSDCDFNSILLYELCYLILDGDLIDCINLSINIKDRYNGEKLYNNTDRDNEYKTCHSIKFCILLAVAARRYSEISADFSDRWDVINSAMRKDLRLNART